MFYFRLILLFFTLFGVIAIVPSHALTLKQAVEKAVTENPRIKAAQASRRATDRVLSQAQSRYFPEIFLGAEYGREIIDRPNSFGPLQNNTWRTRRKAGVNVSQVLFDGFDRANDVYRSQARISAATQRILARSESVALEVTESYIDVIRHDRLIVLAKQNVQRHRQLLSLVEARVIGGRNSEGDLYQIRERLQAAVALLSQIESARDVAAAKYKNAVGVEPGRLGKVKFPKNPFESRAFALRAAIDNNPRLAALRFEIDSAGFRTDQSRADLYPLITLEGSASRGEDIDGTPGPSDELRGMFVMKWKLFDGGVRYNRVEELTEREYVKISEYDTLVRELGEEIDIAWSKYFEGRRQVAAKRKQLEETKKVVAAYLSEYEADKRSLLDVLDSENTKFAVEFDLSTSDAIARFSGYQLLGQTGRLLATLGVANPPGPDTAPNPVPTYTGSRSSFRSFVIPPLNFK